MRTAKLMVLVSDLNVIKATLKRRMGLLNEEKAPVTRPNSRGNKAAIIQQNSEQAMKLFKLNRIKIRWSKICRVSLRAGVLRYSDPNAIITGRCHAQSRTEISSASNVERKSIRHLDAPKSSIVHA